MDLAIGNFLSLAVQVGIIYVYDRLSREISRCVRKLARILTNIKKKWYSTPPGENQTTRKPGKKKENFTLASGCWAWGNNEILGMISQVPKTSNMCFILNPQHLFVVHTISKLLMMNCCNVVIKIQMLTYNNLLCTPTQIWVKEWVMICYTDGARQVFYVDKLKATMFISMSGFDILKYLGLIFHYVEYNDFHGFLYVRFVLEIRLFIYFTKSFDNLISSHFDPSYICISSFNFQALAVWI